MSIVLSPLGPAISRQHIVNYCSEKFGNYIVPPSSPTGSAVFVKRGTSSLKDEARTQAHFYRQAQLSDNAPRVPQVYDVFGDGCGSTYLVMEFIPAPSFEALINTPSLSTSEREIQTATAIGKMANAVAWLLQCPPPEGDSIGPIGGGYMQHIFFGMEEAPIAFASTGALEIYVNKALSRLPGKTKRRVELTKEARLCCPSDVTFKNFLWDGKQVWFVDWQHVNVLPHSFASYYFHRNTDKVVRAVAGLISLQPSTKLDLIGAAASVVIQAGIPDWGLDEHGNKA